jgi:hypothetical protein
MLRLLFCLKETVMTEANESHFEATGCDGSGHPDWCLDDEMKTIDAAAFVLPEGEL